MRLNPNVTVTLHRALISCSVSTIDRFVKLFESSDYETAAFHAATSPHGVLRNINVLEKFKGTFRHVLLQHRGNVA